MSDHYARLEKLLRLQRVVPVVIVDDVANAVSLSRALVAGGIRAIEITLRTPVALEAIRAVAAEVEGAEVGAGTILEPSQWKAAEQAGAKFIVSPGATDSLISEASGSPVPWLPGTSSASEVMHLREHGFNLLKFFPAEQIGGAALLKAFASPLADVKFCPTGGITPAKAPEYLKLPNVACVGGSWLTPADLISRGDWEGVTSLAREASALPH